MLKLVVLAFAVRFLLLSSCESMSVVSKRSNVRLCGRMLTETLNLLCQGQYYDPAEESNSITRREVGQQGEMPDFLPGSYPSSYPVWALNLLPSRALGWNRHQYPPSPRQERGVADECCKKSCPISVLMSYCRAP